MVSGCRLPIERLEFGQKVSGPLIVLDCQSPLPAISLHIIRVSELEPSEAIAPVELVEIHLVTYLVLTGSPLGLLDPEAGQFPDGHRQRHVKAVVVSQANERPLYGRGYRRLAHPTFPVEIHLITTSA